MSEKKLITRRLLLRLLCGAGALPAIISNGIAGGSDDDDNGDKNGGDPIDEDPTPTETSSDNQNEPSPIIAKKGTVLNQDEVKTAISQNKAASLTLLLTYVGITYPGNVLDVKLRILDGTYLYEVKLLSKYVFLHTVTLDAKTLKKIEM